MPDISIAAFGLLAAVVVLASFGNISPRLIKESDVKTLQQVWGKPDPYRKLREFHRWARKVLVVATR